MVQKKLNKFQEKHKQIQKHKTRINPRSSSSTVEGDFEYMNFQHIADEEGEEEEGEEDFNAPPRSIQMMSLCSLSAS